MNGNGTPRVAFAPGHGVSAEENDATSHINTNGNASAANGNNVSSYLITPINSAHSLRDALRATGRRASALDGAGAGSGTTSEEDYDDLTDTSPRPIAGVGQSKSLLHPGEESKIPRRRHVSHSADGSGFLPSPLKIDSSTTTTTGTDAETHKHGYLISADDPAVREIVRNSLQQYAQEKRGKEKPGSSTTQTQGGGRRRGKFSDLVFTRNFSAFDRQNQDAANSPFHGFFTLFWMAVFFFMVKIGADNWKKTGNPLGTNEIMRTMVSRDLFVLLVSDGVMCALAGVSWVLQRGIRRGWVDWDGMGWVVQNIWQTIFIGGVVGLTLLRDWPWTHTVFFVMHGIVMLMKQHSYAFYNGYLSSAYKKRDQLLAKLKQLENISPVQSPSQTEPPVSTISTTHLSLVPSAHEYKERRRSVSLSRVESNKTKRHLKGQGGGQAPTDDIDRIASAISSGHPLDEEQVHVFERLLKWEVDALSDELRGKSTTPSKAYPHNLTLANHYEFITLPTLVYELEYPRSDSINWAYALEKMTACFGIIFVMIMISQAFIYPVVIETIRMKEAQLPLSQRFAYFPWMLSDLIFPFMMEYLLVWYLIWETILNFIAELTCFADRGFYDAWWNCVSWDQFARDWNRPVHNFLLRHVYHSSISAMRVNKHTATLITFFLSACVHELVMWCIFKKLRGYLLVLQMCQLPLVRLSRTRWLRHKATLGNMIFWLGIFTGPSILCSLYLIL